MPKEVSIALALKFIWIQSDGDCSKCNACEEPIYGKMQTLFIEMGEKKAETKVRVCQPCFELSEAQ